MSSSRENKPGKTIAVLLGAGEPRRGMTPSALQPGPGQASILDWLINIYRRLGAEVLFVGGYRFEDILAGYPGIKFQKNAEWRRTGSLYSLSLVEADPEATYFVSYADVVYSPKLVSKLIEARAPLAVAMEGQPLSRYESRSPEDMVRAGLLACSGEGYSVPENWESAAEAETLFEFAGVMKISGEVLRTMAEDPVLQMSDCRRWHLNNLVAHCASRVDVERVDASGLWAELNAPQDMAAFVLSSKAKTLDKLAGAVTLSTILPQYSFSVEEWERRRDGIVSEILSQFRGCGNLVVRSSSSCEDGWDNSGAGAFLSKLEVACDPDILVQSIREVIASYPDSEGGHEVLVQPMLEGVVTSGVALTRTLSHGAPYYTINYDISSRTDTVTGGNGCALKTVVIHRSRPRLPAGVERELAGLMPALQEMERLCGHDCLDVEFAISGDGTVYIFQVRPIAVDHERWKVDDDEVSRILESARTQFEKKAAKSAFLWGSRPVFGSMPDWNPAEIIGAVPRSLAYSLYRYLVTDVTWARQRAEFGYCDVRPQPLISLFAGHPFVDVRASFTSFVPASLPENVQLRLVEHYLERLVANPHLHDKVEFEILNTCLSFDFDQRQRRLDEVGFSAEEISLIRSGLRGINQSGFAKLDPCLNSIRTLEERYSGIEDWDMPPLEKALVLLDDCLEYGTLAFAHLARMGFMAVSFLRSMTDTGLISSLDYDAFFRSLHTVTRQFSTDARAVGEGRLEFETFVVRYGHLRPGTYDITSPCYASDPERFLRPAVSMAGSTPEEEVKKFSWSRKTVERVEAVADSMGLPGDFEDFESFLRKSIEGREYSKFVFSRNLSKALECLAEFGAEMDLGRSLLANVTIYDFKGLALGQAGGYPRNWLVSRADEGAQLYRVASAVDLPALLVSSEDLFCFKHHESLPNFIGMKQCVAEVYCLTSSTVTAEHLAGKIVLIEQADPGYDWLFGQGIAGLITCFGGANSHMAIRAAELSLPAAIGVGESMYRKLAGARMINLDCKTRRLEVL